MKFNTAFLELLTYFFAGGGVVGVGFGAGIGAGAVAVFTGGLAASVGTLGCPSGSVFGGVAGSCAAVGFCWAGCWVACLQLVKSRRKIVARFIFQFPHEKQVKEL